MAKNITKKGQANRERIIECAAELFLKNGYQATGINDILDIVGIAKGSFYSYFKSKKELALLVSEFFGNKFLKKWLNKIAEGKNWTDFVNQMTDDLRYNAKNHILHGCPIGILGVENTNTDPDISQVFIQAIQSFQNIFYEVLSNTGIETEKARNLSKKAFILYEGHLLLYRITGQISDISDLKADLLALL